MMTNVHLEIIFRIKWARQKIKKDGDKKCP